MYLQGCLTYKWWSAPNLNCRYLNPYIKLKLIGLVIRLYQTVWKKKWIVEFFTTSKCKHPNHLLDVTCEREFYFAYLMCSSVSRAKALKKVSAICHIWFLWKVTEHFWNRIKKIWSDHTKIALEKKGFRNKIFADTIMLPRRFPVQMQASYYTCWGYSVDAAGHISLKYNVGGF